MLTLWGLKPWVEWFPMTDPSWGFFTFEKDSLDLPYHGFETMIDANKTGVVVDGQSYHDHGIHTDWFQYWDGGRRWFGGPPWDSEMNEVTFFTIKNRTWLTIVNIWSWSWWWRYVWKNWGVHQDFAQLDHLDQKHRGLHDKLLIQDGAPQICLLVYKPL